MGRFKSLGDTPEMIEVFRKFPAGVWQLCEYHDIKLRGDSPLTVAERELIAAYVSGINACQYCYDAHKSISEMYGIDEMLLDRLMTEPGSAEIDKKMLPILAFVKKLTLTPSKMTDADSDAVYAAGWDEQALYDAIIVCALFNFMNRLVDGSGIVSNQSMVKDMREKMGEHINHEEFYRDFARYIEQTGD